MEAVDMPSEQVATMLCEGTLPARTIRVASTIVLHGAPCSTPHQVNED